MKKEDFDTVKVLFEEGLGKQNPRASMPYSRISEILKTTTTFICVKDNNIIGLVSFTASKKRIDLEFIYAVKSRQGVGKALMLKVAKYAIKHNIALIRSSVSIIDEDASAFYKSLGFSKGKKMDWFLYAISAPARTVVSRSSIC